jgi:hypothetical protein
MIETFLPSSVHINGSRPYFKMGLKKVEIKKENPLVYRIKYRKSPS